MNKRSIPKIIKNINVVNCGNIEHTQVIIIPAIILPIITDNTVGQNLSLKETPIQVPVHTPVSGRGIATNVKTPRNLKITCLRLILLIDF